MPDDLAPSIFLNVEELFTTMDRRRRLERLTWRQVASQAGVSASTFSRMALDSAPPNVNGLCRMLVWLGITDVRRFLRIEPIAEPTTTGDPR